MQVNKVKAVFSRKGKLYIEFYDNNGKVKQKTTTLKDTRTNRILVQREVIPAFEARLQERLEIKRNRTFGEYIDMYVRLNSHHSKAVAHKGRVERFKKFFGTDTKIQDINEIDIEEFFWTLKIERETKKDWLGVLRKIFSYAVIEKSLTVNIAKQFELPRQQRINPKSRSVMPFSKEEVHKLLEAVEGDRRNYLGIGFYSGMRPEEIIALTPEDLDFENRLIHVRRAISKGILKETKTYASDRVIPMFSDIEPFLHSQLQSAKEKNSLFLFSDESGNHLPDIVSIRKKKGRLNSWATELEKQGLVYRPIKNTRHTFAVEAIKSGKMTHQEIASILGHTSLRTLYKHYASHLGASHLKLDRSIDIFLDS